MKKLFQVKMDVMSMVYLAMFAALTVILSYINSFFPEMPQGGTVSIDIISIFVCAYLMGPGYGIICGVVTSMLQFALGMASFYGPWSVLLDYVLPLAVCGFAPLLKNIKIGQFELYTGVILSMFLKFLSHFASGAFLFASYAPEGVSPIVYSIGYNAPYNLATLALCLIIMPLLYPRIKNAAKPFH